MSTLWTSKKNFFQRLNTRLEKFFLHSKWRLFSFNFIKLSNDAFIIRRHLKNSLSFARARSRNPCRQPEMTPEDKRIVGDEEKWFTKSMSTGKIYWYLLRCNAENWSFNVMFWQYTPWRSDFDQAQIIAYCTESSVHSGRVI